nr:TonB-dependent receptor [Herbaspirillum aquaticum]
MSSRDSAFSPRLAFLYEVTPAFIPYIQYARGFRSPSPQEINSFFNNTVYRQISNPDLKPETSNTVEVGLRGKLAAGPGALRYSAAAYKGNYRNFIDLVTVRGNLTVANPTIFQYRNAAKAEIHGLEGRIDYALDNGFTVKGGFAWTKGTTTANGVEQGLESVAPLSVVTGLRYERPQQWFVQGDLVYNAAKKKEDIPTATNFVSPSFFVMDLSGGVHLTRNMTVTAGIRNLFDRKYWSWTDNVLDPDFNLHLRAKAVDHGWVVRRPTDHGMITSVEFYDAQGKQIVNFFSRRDRGQPETMQWRNMVEALPRG